MANDSKAQAFMESRALDVAIKVLPDIYSGDPERLARFDREAKLLATLNHPNIAVIYGFEEAEWKPRAL
jgi:serine/threonine protein kinase